MQNSGLKYKMYKPGLRESWSNGFMAYAAHPPVKRKTPCYLGSGCHDKPHLGKTLFCSLGKHRWELNFFRGQNSPHHYHCLYCGIADDLYSQYDSGGIEIVLEDNSEEYV